MLTFDFYVYHSKLLVGISKVRRIPDEPDGTLTFAETQEVKMKDSLGPKVGGSSLVIHLLHFPKPPLLTRATLLRCL